MRRAALQGLRERGVLPIDTLPVGEPSVELEKWFLPGAAVLSGTLAGVRQHGEPGDTGDEVFLGVNVAGQSFAHQGRSDLVIGTGDGIVVTPGTGAFSIARPTPARFIGLRVPRHEVATAQAVTGDRGARVVPRTHPALRLLTNYVQVVLDDGGVSASPILARTVVKHLHELVALSLGSEPAEGRHGSGVRAARLAAIKADIEANLADNALTVATVAARHGLSARYLHLLFESEGTTFTQFVLSRRLDDAYQRLRDPRFASQTISTIAYGAGFGDLSYFNRTFRRRYDASPSQIRDL